MVDDKFWALKKKKKVCIYVFLVKYNTKPCVNLNHESQKVKNIDVKILIIIKQQQILCVISSEENTFECFHYIYQDNHTEQLSSTTLPLNTGFNLKDKAGHIILILYMIFSYCQQIP